MSAEHEKPSIQTILYIRVRKNPIVRLFIWFHGMANSIVFHSDQRRRTVKGKGYNDHVYYVLRGDLVGIGSMAGLFALYYSFGGIAYAALKKDQIPYADFERYPCQYSVDREINGTKNAWEYYFEQPFTPPEGGYEAYTGKKIILSGWQLRRSKKDRQLEQEWYNMPRQERKAFFQTYLPVKNYIQEEVQKIYREQFEGNNVLGVFMRGTDYVARKPLWHKVQPTPEQVKRKIDEFLAAYKIDKIFLVTEDWNNYQYIKSFYGDRVFCSDYEFVNFDAKKDKWVKDAFHDDPYERGKRYLIRIMLLSMCKYYVGGQGANGSRYALDFGNFDAEYTFDLGSY